jgi:uncharacterized membrane protein
MTWSHRFRIRETVRGSLWVVPLAGAIAGSLLGLVVSLLDEHYDLPDVWVYSPSTASTVLTSIVGAAAALTGFVVTVTVLVVQMATGTFSARYMRLWYRDGMLKAVLALLVGTLTFSFSMLRRIESNFVPDLGVTIAGSLIVLSILTFILFFDRFVHRLRPVAVAALVGRAGRKAFLEAVQVAGRREIGWGEPVGMAEPSFVARASRAGSIQAVDADGLVRWAHEHRAELVLPHSVGDFVPTGAALVRVFGGDDGAQGESAARELEGMIALGDERTIQQDPAFAIRIIVDIADKALSAAVNDPTTAVQALDHLAELLRLIGSTDLEGLTHRHEGPPPAVVMRARRWEDFLSLGVTEIREYGSGSIQVMRRLRAVLDELEETVRPEHRAAVREERARLDAVVESAWGGSVDVDRARVPDRQGIGSPTA